MSTAAFLDTGVVLGFCFRDDDHHFRCKQYLDDIERSLYISDNVESEYLGRKPNLAEEVADGVFEHIDRLRSSSYEGQLDSMDTSQIRQNLIPLGNNASTTLNEFYKSEVPNFILLDELEDRLRDLARDIEQNANENMDWLLDRTVIWCRENTYPDIVEELLEIPEDDREICLDAHDVVVVNGNSTELATTNPTDFVDGGYRELILEHTYLDDVVSLAVRS